MDAITALLLFAAWTLLLMFTYVGYRTSKVLQGSSADTWTRGRGTPIPAFVARAEHAHANCVENLPVFASVVLGAYALGKAPLVDAVGVYILVARLAQSTVHLVGVNHVLVLLRATFYTVQVVLMLYAIAGLVS